MSWFKSKRTVSTAAVTEALNAADVLHGESYIRGVRPRPRPVMYRPGQVVEFSDSVERILICDSPHVYCASDCVQFHPTAESGFDKMPKKKLTPYSPSTTNFNVDYV